MKLFPLLLIVISLNTYPLLAQSQQYLLVDAGASIGGPAGKVKDQMIASGFGDAKPGFFGANEMPKKKTIPLSLQLRYGWQLKNKNTIELGAGVLNSSTVEGFDHNQSSASLFGNAGNSLTFRSSVYAVYGHYIFRASNKAGIGVGPALVLNNAKYTTETNTSTDLQVLPGLSFTSLFKLVDKSRWFLALRADAKAYTPAKLNSVTVTSNGYTSTMQEVKTGGVIGTLSIGAGIKL